MSNVIQISDLRFTRAGEPPDPEHACLHKKLRVDPNGEIVTCEDCGVQVEAFWALSALVERYGTALRHLEERERRLEKDLQASVTHRAAKKVEVVWRERKMLPRCPHCGSGILPEDGLGDSLIGREFELRRRAKQVSGTSVPPTKEVIHE